MYCRYCGADMGNGTVCPRCGRVDNEAAWNAYRSQGQYYNPYPYGVPPQPTYSSWAIAGFVLALAGIFFGLVCAILGLVFSNKALKEVYTPQYKGLELARAGRIISIVGLSIYGGLVLLAILFSIVFSFTLMF